MAKEKDMVAKLNLYNVTREFEDSDGIREFINETDLLLDRDVSRNFFIELKNEDVFIRENGIQYQGRNHVVSNYKDGFSAITHNEYTVEFTKEQLREFLATVDKEVLKEVLPMDVVTLDELGEMDSEQVWDETERVWEESNEIPWANLTRSEQMELYNQMLERKLEEKNAVQENEVKDFSEDYMGYDEYVKYKQLNQSITHDLIRELMQPNEKENTQKYLNEFELLTTKAILGCPEHEEAKIQMEQELIHNQLYEYGKDYIVRSQRVDLENQESTYDVVLNEELYSFIGSRADVKNGVDVGIKDGLITFLQHGQGYTCMINDHVYYDHVLEEAKLVMIDRDKAFDLFSKIDDISSLSEIYTYLANEFNKEVGNGNDKEIIEQLRENRNSMSHSLADRINGFNQVRESNDTTLSGRDANKDLEK